MENKKEIKRYHAETVRFDEVFCLGLIEAINPTYPRWEKKLIKRKYGKHKAKYLDVWIPIGPTLFSLLPKYKWTKQNWNTKKIIR